MLARHCCALLLASAAALAQEPEPPPPPRLGQLTGLVRTRGTRAPIVGAAVGVEGEPPALTGVDGRFTLSLAPGVHQLRVLAPDHAPLSLEETVREAESIEVLYGLTPLRPNPYQTVVRAEKERTEVSRVTLHDEELRAVPGTLGDPFRVVMLLPGVASLSSGLAYPVVRGSQPAATGYFLDGVRVPLLFHLLLGPAVVHPDFIDTIDFYPGVAPPEFGRFIGGIVSGKVRPPREDGPHFNLYADLINTGALVEVPLPRTGTNVTLAGRFSYTGWLLALAQRATQQEGSTDLRYGADFYDYQARVEQKVGAGKLRLLAFGSSDLVSGKNDPLKISVEGLTRFHKVDLRFQHPLLSGTFEVGANGGIESTGLSETGRGGDSSELSYRQAVFSARASWRGELGHTVHLTAGVDAEQRRGTVTVVGGQTPLIQAGRRAGDQLDQPTAIGTFVGGFAELAWRPTPRWSIVPGLRVDNYHLVPGIDRQAVEPRLTVRHALTDTLTLKGGAGLFHQPPTVLVTLPVLDTAGLRYGLQEQVQVDVGAEWRFAQGWELGVDAYYNPLLRGVEFDLGEVMTQRRSGTASSGSLDGKGRAFGVELLLRHPLGRGWFGWLSYSFQNAQRLRTFSRYDDDDLPREQATAWVPFAYEQRHVLNLSVSWEVGNGWTLGASGHFHTGKPETGEITSRAQRQVVGEDGLTRWVRVDLDQASRLPPFFRLDARVSKTFTFDSFVVEAYLDFMNFTLRQEVLGYFYEDETDITAPQRKPVSLPVFLPMLGIKGSY